MQPLTGRLADIWGQHRLLPVLIAVHALVLVGFVLAVTVGANDIALGALAVAIGGTMPGVGGMIRARWAYVGPSPQVVRTGFAIESLLDEVVYIVGPVLATFLALSLAAYTPLVASGLLVLAGGIPLALQRRTEPPRRLDEHPRERIPVRTLLIIIAGMVMLGVVFGALEIGYVAAANQDGHPGATGALYSAYSVGSLVSGLVFGSRHLTWPLPKQWVVLAAALAVATALLPFSPNLGWLIAVSFIAGLAVSPNLITGLTLAQRIMPESRLTEALTWALASIGVGMAFAAALAGALVDSHGASAAFWVSAAGGGGAFLVTLLGRSHLLAAETRAAGVSPQVSGDH